MSAIAHWLPNGENIAVAIFIGLAATCAILLVLSVFLIAIRYFRPLTGAIGKPESDVAESDINTRLDALSKSVAEKMNDIQQQLNIMGEKCYSFRILYEIHRLEPEIDRLVKSLNRPLEKSEEPQDWDLWKNDYIEIRSRLKRFIGLTQFYHRDIDNLIFHIPPDVFKSHNWTFSPEIFPDADLLQDFKSFRYITQKYREIGGDVVNAISRKSL